MTDINRKNTDQQASVSKGNAETDTIHETQPLDTLDSDFQDPKWRRGSFIRESVDANGNVIKSDKNTETPD